MAGTPYIQFGSGYLFLNPNAGNLAVNPTPVKPYTIQDVKIGQKGKIEMLRGQYQYPDDTATGDKDGTFEFSMGRRDWGLLNQIFNADAITSGITSVAPNVAGTIPATGPYTLTPAVPASGTWAEDLGVSVQSNNQQLTKVASGPTTGQYSVAAGVYTFAAADTNKGVFISFAYTVSAQGFTYEVNNQAQGFGPAFECYLVDTYQPVSGVYSCIYLAQAKISDVEISNKRSGYGMVDLKGSYYASPNGRVINFYSNV